MEYRDRFGEALPTRSLTLDQEPEAVLIIQEALANDRPFTDDADFLGRLGSEPLPPDCYS
jgi:hypothetical protein